MSLAQDKSAPVTIGGTVLSDSHEPLADAVVEILGITHTRTDSGGRFRLTDLPPGILILQARLIGYGPVMKMIETEAGDDLTVSITLRQTTTQLPAIVVVERSTPTPLSDPTGFERRRREATGGQFIGEEEIAKVRFTETSMLFRGRPGVTVGREGKVATDRKVYIDRGAVTAIGRPCGPAQVFVNAVLMPEDFSVDVVPLASIRDVEIYAGPATTPLQFRSFRTVCGTIAIWTK